MKPSGPIARRTPLQRSAPVPRSSQMARNAGPQPKPTKPSRPRDTGPPQRVRSLVASRSQGWCEWSMCPNHATDLHHRLNRKAGGRHGEMAVRINQAAWLLHSCRYHHETVTSPYGEARLFALAAGWLLLEGHDALLVPAVTRHGRVWLRNCGGFRTSPPVVVS